MRISDWSSDVCSSDRGAVLVLGKTGRLRRGHLAVVAEVRSSREIIVHQANWLNGGRIHRYTPVRDVSKNNDWSAVRVWYTPGRVYEIGEASCSERVGQYV